MFRIRGLFPKIRRISSFQFNILYSARKGIFCSSCFMKNRESSLPMKDNLLYNFKFVKRFFIFCDGKIKSFGNI